MLHNHNHNHFHVHTIKYCEQCDTVYCPSCGKEWTAKITYSYLTGTLNRGITTFTAHKHG